MDLTAECTQLKPGYFSWGKKREEIARFNKASKLGLNLWGWFIRVLTPSAEGKPLPGGGRFVVVMGETWPATKPRLVDGGRVGRGV